MESPLPPPSPAGARAKTTATTPIVIVLALAGIIVSIMQTLVIPIIPHLPEYLDAEASDTAWVVTATLLSGTVATPVMGRLGDMFGKRRMLLISLALLASGSFVAALSSNLMSLVVGRAFQGLAAGAIPLGISIMRDILPREKLAGSIAVMSASLGVGGAFGLPVGALIAEYADWHALFWMSAFLGAITIVAVAQVVPESSVNSGGRFDYVGASALSLSLVALLLGVTKGGDWGWTNSTTIVAFVVATVTASAWAGWELRFSQPIIDLRVTFRRQVLLTNIASAAFGFAMFAASMVLPQIVQLPQATGYGLGGSTLMAGLVMAPFGAVLLIAAPASSHLTNKFGPKTSLMCGALVVTAGYLVGTFYLHSTWQLITTGVIIGFGTGLAYAAMPALVIGAVPPTQTGAANSFNTLMRALGTSFASAIAGVIFAQFATGAGDGSNPSEAAFAVMMALGAGSASVAFVVAAFLPRRRRGILTDEKTPSFLYQSSGKH